MRAAAVLAAIVGVGAVWREGEHEQDPVVTKEYLASKYRVEMPPIMGRSNCGDGKRCVALVSMLGLYSFERPSDSLLNCTETNPNVITPECEYYFGTLGNLIHHKNRLRKEARKSDYVIDMVLIHDDTVPQFAVDQIRALGVRTMGIPVMAKRLACRGFVKKNPRTRVYMEMCDKYDFNLQRFPQIALRMFLMSMKPIALGMTGYERVMFADVDAFMDGGRGAIDALDYTYNHENVGLLSNMDRFSPVNAGIWVAKPSLEAVDIWLSDIKMGFNSELGWGGYGQIKKIWQKDFVKSPDAKSRIYDKYGVGNDPAWEDIKGSWNFLGAQMDQGLLFHIFALKMKNLHFMNTMNYVIPQSEGVTNATGIVSSGFNHYASHPKPWSANVCIKEHHRFKPEDYLKVIKAVSKEVRAIAYYFKDQNPVLNSCATYLHNLARQCRLQMMNKNEEGWYKKVMGAPSA
mmetsp:Transcript_22046/g.41313  ORF Transcript_22046/g.41313 Transcript_22046/m.41313 type:complete len:460 (-) Transcript_22046:411-1790(-)